MMRKIIGLIVLMLTITTVNVTAQEETIMTVGGDAVTLSEFENIYNKNSSNLQDQEEQSLDDYVKLFVNFKLKVKEALELKMDTDKAFINELAGYRTQLAKPYLEDREVTEQLIKEAYDRLKYEINAKHILVVLPNNSTPADTMKAFAKIKVLRQKAIKKNADFERIMRDSKTPDKVKDKEVIAEDLGYLSAFQMVYNFESTAYTTPVGEVSNIIRTRFGYHIMKVYDKRENRGEIKAAHIMVSTPKAMTADQAVQKKAKIEEIYGKLKAGEDLGQLAKLYSDDKGSAKRAGELPWFGSGRMVDEFEAAAFALAADGDVSAPIKTKYGWHIIKRIDNKGLKSFEESESEIRHKIAKDGRSTKSKSSLIAKIKANGGYKLDKKSLQAFYKVVDDSYKLGRWNADAAKELQGVMFTLTDDKYTQTSKNFTQQEFAKYLQDSQRRYAKATKEEFIEGVFQSFSEKACVDFEDGLLEVKYIDFKLLMREYRDGILLFELMDDKVWSKAVKDSLGLAKFYAVNKTNYMWEQRVEASIYTCENAEVAATAKKLIKKQAKKGYTDQYIIDQLNVDSQLNCSIESDKYLKGDNAEIDKIAWVKAIYDVSAPEEGKVKFINVKQVIKPMPKLLSECKGLVTADYQKYLEQEWIKELSAKYPVEINKEVLAKVK
ncbi:MAG: peptidylprolyl isomerase [Flavobacteriales bacterium]|nr:peptidylprolyl isomerase [Flavobacteriales bacterium]